MLALRPLLRRIPEAVVMVAGHLCGDEVESGGPGNRPGRPDSRGLPHPDPNVGLDDILTMLPVAVGVALVSYVDTTITGRAFAMRGGYSVDPNQELIAVGLANVGTGFFQGSTIGSSHSRTAINEITAAAASTPDSQPPSCWPCFYSTLPIS